VKLCHIHRSTMGSFDTQCS